MSAHMTRKCVAGRSVWFRETSLRIMPGFAYPLAAALKKLDSNLTRSPTFIDHLQATHRMIAKFAIAPQHKHLFWISDLFWVDVCDDADKGWIDPRF